MVARAFQLNFAQGKNKKKGFKKIQKRGFKKQNTKMKAAWRRGPV
jgi:hypothetical protein